MAFKKLIASTLIYTVIGALPLASAFFLLPFYLNYLTISDFGSLALYISFTGLIQILINYGLDTYIGISYFEHKSDISLLKRQIGNIVGYLLIFGIGTTILITTLGNKIFEVIFNKNGMTFFPFGFMCVLTAFFNSFFKTYSNLLVNQQRPLQFLWVNLANFIMTIGISLAGILLYPYTLIGPMWGRLLSGVGIFIIALLFFNKEFDIRFEVNAALKNALAFSIPVLVYFLLLWLISNIDRYIINIFMTREDIAIFDLAIKCTLLVEFILKGLASVIMPKIYEMIYKEHLSYTTPEFNKYFSSFTAISLISIPVITFLIPLLLPLIVYKQAYNQSFLFLSILSIGFVSNGLSGYFQTPIYYFKKTKVLPKIYLYTAIIQVIITIFFIKYWGLWGAVAANLITKFVQNVFLYVEARKIFIFKFNVIKLVVLPLVVVAYVVVSEIFISYHNMHWIRLSQLIVSIGLVTLIYRKELLSFFKQFIMKQA